MARKRPNSHPDDESLLSLGERGVPPDELTLEHVADCARCDERLRELEATRRLLREAGARRFAPPHDLAGSAINRLRLREKAIGNMNEVFAAVRALFVGLADIFGGQPPEGRTPPPDSEVPHG